MSLTTFFKKHFLRRKNKTSAGDRHQHGKRFRFKRRNAIRKLPHTSTDRILQKLQARKKKKKTKQKKKKKEDIAKDEKHRIRYVLSHVPPVVDNNRSNGGIQRALKHKQDMYIKEFVRAHDEKFDIAPDKKINVKSYHKTQYMLY